MTLLEMKNISKAFPIEGGIFRKRIGFVQALKDVSIDVRKGETLALVGGSGCGKSTLARIVAGLLTPDSGDVLWEGRSLSTCARQERARLIQMIFQDPYASLNPKLSVGTQLMEVVRLALTPPSGTLSLKGEGKAGSMRATCVDLLESVGLSGDALSHYPFQFSGGQRQRIAIARALALQPRLLIADEPLSALDVTVQAQILALFKGLKSTLDLTFLFITHDLAVAANFADRIVVLKEGEVVEEGTPATTLVAPKHPYTRALLDAVPALPR